MSDADSLTLGGISAELIIKILHFCECPAILRFAATCKAYRELVTESVSLQLHIELEANGLELVSGSFKQGATYSVILDDLRQFRDGWLDLNLGEPIVRPLGKSEMLLWELREGFYIKAFSHSDGRSIDGLQFIPLDSKTLDPPPLRFDFTLTEFTADPGQGLVAILSRDPSRDNITHIHLCSVATGLAHPLAQHPRLTVEHDFDPPHFSATGFAIEIMGHAVLAKIAHTQDNKYEVLVWNWRSGVLLHRISSQEGMCDFTFLDQQHLVLLSVTRSNPDHDDLNLLVYTIPDNIPPCAPSTDKLLRAEDVPVSRPILSLGFPKIKQSSQVSEVGFLLRSDPTPGRTMYKNSAAFACPYATTLSMTFGFNESDFSFEEPPFYRVFVDGRSLIDRVHAIPHDSTTVLPWSSWGADTTRWFLAPEPPDHWICWMSGSKYIRPLPESPYYSIFDFSSPSFGRFQERNKRLYLAAFERLVNYSGLPIAEGFQLEDLDLLDHYLLALLEGSPDTGPVVIGVGADIPSVIRTDDINPGFDEPITSRLPYRLACKTKNDKNHEGWQINGDCVVGVASWGAQAESISIYKLTNRLGCDNSI